MPTQDKPKAGEPPPQAHTPGPWEVVGATQIAKTGEDWACIAEVHNPRQMHPDSMGKAEPASISNPRFHEACANARLIAAAPETKAQRDELLAMLWELIEVESRYGSHEATDRARIEAHKKARTAIALAEGRVQ